ncbi:MAG: AAA family ATPase [Candidatus Spechtbacterales bacterium]|nr:AAA family ATPase [Candidatus Spechtbacterales bacterium]
MSSKEIERRFLVFEIDEDEFFSAIEGQKDIVQGYYELPGPFQHLRVRIADGDADKVRAILTTKEGFGLERIEREKEVGLEAGRFLLDASWHFLEKVRFLRDGWEVDFLRPPLENIILAEYEMESADEEVKLPPWIITAEEVTESLTNLHLARFATQLRNLQTKGAISPDVILKYSANMPTVVLTGPPCSGKSTVLKKVQEKYGEDIHCVPEAATLLIAHAGVLPIVDKEVAELDPTAEARKMHNFQKSLYSLQGTLESSCIEHAQSIGKTGTLIDRGTRDSAAYLEEGTDEFERVMRTKTAWEDARYDMVIYFEAPPKDIFEREKKNNPARHETYEEVLALQNTTLLAWQGHPNFHFIPNGSGWEQKEARAMALIEEAFDLN